MNSAESISQLLPPPVRDERGRAFAACLGTSAALEPFLACPAKTAAAPDASGAAGRTPDAVLLALARQHGVGGGLWQAMATRAQKEALVDSAMLLQRRRGTPWAVEEVMRLFGYSDAYVLDRARLLVYDGEAIHDGAYSFEAGFGSFGDYLLRLFIAPDSRALEAPDREEAIILAGAWAPLRSRLVGIHARHVLASRIERPMEAAQSVGAIVLRSGANADGMAPRQEMHKFWLETKQESVTVRWRVNAANLQIPDIRDIALLKIGGLLEIERRSMPPIAAAPLVTYEGAWTLTASEEG
jgi:hypothetical protein